jgi:succinyl-CoA synthetase beta subunit
MAALLESDVKRLLAQHGLDVPGGRACRSPEEARAVARELDGEVVVKALIPAKGKQLAGAVHFAATPDAAAQAAHALLHATIAGFAVDAILVERRERLATEIYAAVELDGHARAYRLTVAAAGGANVERELAQGRGRTLHFHPHAVPFAYQVRDLLIACGIEGAPLRHVPDAIAGACRAAIAADLTLLEVNPVGVRDDATACVIGVLGAIDESALPRQRELAAHAVPHVDQLLRPRTTWEKAVDALDDALPAGGDIRFGEFPGGDIGMMVLGGGAGLMALDAVMRAGGKPANFLDMTSAASPEAEEKVYRLTRTFLDVEHLRGLLIGSNIGAFLPVPVRMRGIARAVRESRRPGPGFPVVVRLAGIADDEVPPIIEGLPLTYFRDDVTLEEAVAAFMHRLSPSP